MINRLNINLQAVKHNISIVKNLVGTKKIMAVVKGDAYGHGIEQISTVLDPHVDHYAVASIIEGIKLRRNGIKKPILVLNPIIDPKTALKWDLTLTISSNSDIHTLNQLINHLNVKLKVHVKIDTGLGRFGFNPSQIYQFVKCFKMCNIQIDGIYTHSSSYDVESQFNTFKRCLEYLNQNGIYAPLKHMSNSYLTLNYPMTHFDLVRVGAVLYGLSPGGMNQFNLSQFDLKPAMSLESKIISIKTIPPGYQISYSRKFTTKCETRVAAIPIGFADGYPITNGEVMVRDMKVPIVGLFMNVMLVDVTNKHVSVGDTVTLIGKEMILGDIAEKNGLKDSQLACQLGHHLKRNYIN
jgi:alanine racemase